MYTARFSNPTIGLLVCVWFLGAQSCAPVSRQADLSESRVCRAELRSWVVAGKGRHLFLDIDCPEPDSDLSGIVEFANTQFRDDFDWHVDRDGPALNSRMEQGVRVRPAVGEPDNRLEATYSLTLAEAECLLHDRLFSRPYALLGPNSNSAMRAVCDECDIELPKRVLAGSGWLGEFPGINMSPGEEIPRAQWSKFGAIGASH
jgi:hypothetical protein